MLINNKVQKGGNTKHQQIPTLSSITKTDAVGMETPLDEGNATMKGQSSNAQRLHRSFGSSKPLMRSRRGKTWSSKGWTCHVLLFLWQKPWIQRGNSVHWVNLCKDKSILSHGLPKGKSAIVYSSYISSGTRIAHVDARGTQTPTLLVGRNENWQHHGP